MRAFLDRLYQGSGVLAAIFLAAICGIALLQVGANIVDLIAKWITGAPIGLVVESYAEFGGYFLAAASFLALAHAFRRGSHIRVTLLIRHMGRRRRRSVELWCVFIAGLLTAYLTFYLFEQVYDSIEFGDVSYGLVPVPLWIPQLSLAIGTLIFTIALIDEYFAQLAGAEPSYADTGDELSE